MKWYIILALVSFSICLLSCLYHFFKIIRLGKPADFTESIGDVSAAVAYSFTGGMSPAKKESAYLHKPTYTAGMIYHVGTFLSFALFFCFLFNIFFSETIDLTISGFLIISGLCGIGIFIKRLIKKELKSISNPDDFISNFLVTVFQLVTAVNLNFPTPVYFVLTSILFLYLPLGKLKHTVYFFAARYHLGFFYCKRSVWPPKE